MGSPRLVVMGVSGCGKSTVGRLLAQRQVIGFLEGDELHSTQNIARMARGVALTDEDRQGWLLAVAQRLADSCAGGRGLVVSCSALKRSYRDILRRGAADLRFIYLRGDRAMLADRMAARTGHYMPASLLESQFAALEEPAADEKALAVDVAQSPEAVAAAVERWLGLVGGIDSQRTSP